MVGPGTTLILPADIVITPVAELPNGIRNRFDAPPGAYTVTRPRSRTLTKILDAEGADLLREFRTPRRIVEAVLSYSLARHLDPEATLQAAFPLFDDLISNQLLVEPGSAAALPVSPTLTIGSSWRDYRVVRCAASLTDTEVYEVADSGGRRLALKIARAHASPDIRDALSREAEILRYLSGVPSPGLVAEGEEDGRRFILSEWISGTDAETAAFHARETGDEGALLELCEQVVDSYASLHHRGVVHGDVHPSNLIVSRSGTVAIVDYGWSTRATPGQRQGHLPRAGVPEFFEPEYARALLRRRKVPGASVISDQYGVAVVLYRMLTGQAYLRFSLEEHQSLIQIARDPPLAFAIHGVDRGPAVEGALLRALAKTPAERFSSMTAFAEALRRGRASRFPPPLRTGPNTTRRFLDLTLRRLGPDGVLVNAAVRTSPICSIYLGMAGTAVGLLHIACAREDPRLLSHAELWAELCGHMSGRRSAFLSPRLEMTALLVGRVSIFHARPGVGYLAALLAHARGDSSRRDLALFHWLRVTGVRSRQIELSLGEAGVLLALGFAAELVGKGNPPLRRRIGAAGKRLHDKLCRSLKRRGALNRLDRRLNLGVAHGWAGVLYAILRWEQTTGSSPNPGVEARLDELARLATTAESGARWPWLTLDEQGRTTSSYMPGWCNGSAGMIGLWTLANRVTGEDRFLQMAELAALDAWQQDPGDTHLCCGLAGIAYGLLNLYRHTGEPIWLERSRLLAERAATRALNATRMHPSATAHSLFRGDVGLAVLLTDLERPEGAAFPLFDAPG
jgi:serine/threonine-protein kinase